jgi:hypothetical protein
MTKMISKYDAYSWAEDEDTDDVIECLISNDKFELIEMLIDRVKTMEVGDSVMMNLVPDADEEELEWMAKSEFLDTNCTVKSEIVYTLGA